MKRRGVATAVVLLLLMSGFLYFQRIQSSKLSEDLQPPAPRADEKRTVAKTPLALPQSETLENPGLVLKSNSLQSALELGSELARQWGLKAQELRPISDKAAESRFQKSYGFLQYFEGEEVYGGRLSFVVAADTGEVLFVNNDLKDFDEINEKRDQSLEDSQEFLEKSWAHRQPVVEKMRAQPVLYVSKRSAEWAWKFSVKIQKPHYDHREVLVSAARPAILVDRSHLTR